MIGDLGSRQSPVASSRAGWMMLLALMIGALIGAVTSIGQAHLDPPGSALVNSASPWLLGGFVAGSCQLRQRMATAAGLAACVAEVLTYYAVTSARGFAASTSEIVFWSVCAVVGGPLFGWAGWAWRRGPFRARPWGAVLAPATFIAEAIGAYQVRLHQESAVVLYLLIGAGVGLVVVLASAAVRRQPLTTCTAAVLVILAGVLTYGPLLGAVGGLAFG